MEANAIVANHHRTDHLVLHHRPHSEAHLTVSQVGDSSHVHAILDE